MADIAEGIARPHGLDSQHQRVIGDLDQPLGFARQIARHEHARCVAIPAIDNHRDINVENVAGLEQLVTRNTMADHMIDRDAAGMLIAPIPDRRRGRPSLRDLPGDDTVDLAGCLAGKDMVGDVIEYRRGQASCLVHACKIRRAVDANPLARNPPVMCLVHGKTPLFLHRAAK